LDQLLETHSKILLLNATEDLSIPIESLDINRAELMRKKRKFDYLVIPGANHGLDLPTDQQGEGMSRIFTKILNWFEK